MTPQSDIAELERLIEQYNEAENIAELLIVANASKDFFRSKGPASRLLEMLKGNVDE